MVYIKRNPRSTLTGKEIADMEQPLDYKTGYSNPKFDKLYGQDKNPYKGSERDRNKRKRYF